ncbi:isocitrate lyase/phosphoenolpyruvate mutase family protein [Streptomyces sp. NRRL WC-3742]|uniref:isocitrate lyase/phosphoenolpyruvate mutase family protein n=1 Tax=Streptomyces sp. NRRL WC-3742 TaxID=1463934 RepID=UPI00056B6F13|nr:isocitrate lyase/phosphoenolpyruvate mutase family protein [Streptomyces sp. NRRL WC-3742]
MTHTTHEFDRYADITEALADPALVPELPGPHGEPGAVAGVAWLRATVARFSSGEAHRRRRALVEAELARLEPGALRRAAAAGPAEGEARIRVVRTLAGALGMPEPGEVAEAVAVVAGAYFGGAGADTDANAETGADAAVARLVALLQPEPADAAGLEALANRIGLLVQACAATAALVEASAGADVPLARVLRETPPVAAMRRTAARDTRVAGREIAAGDLVLLDLAAAHRTHPVPLTFGAPPRLCPGRAHALALAEGLLRRPRTPFALLHEQAEPLLLPNAWDHASAALLAARGFPAVGTTSLGVAAAAGLPDGTGATVRDTLALARRLGRDSLLFTVDVEGGFSEDPQQVAELARELYEAGAAGINLEDGRPDGTLAPVELHAAKIAAVKASVPALFVNARTDTHWLGRQQEETAPRLAVYEQAGADGVFAPGLSDPDKIAALLATVTTPLNILYAPGGPGVAELAALGVRRISLGSLLYRNALAAAVSTATAVREGLPLEPSAVSYTEVQALGS